MDVKGQTQVETQQDEMKYKLQGRFPNFDPKRTTWTTRLTPTMLQVWGVEKGGDLTADQPKFSVTIFLTQQARQTPTTLPSGHLFSFAWSVLRI